jgi:hypothetical protein
MQEAARRRRNTMIAAGAGAILPQSGRTPKRNQRKAMGQVISRVISALCGLCTAAFPAAPGAHTEATTLRDTYADARIPR